MSHIVKSIIKNMLTDPEYLYDVISEIVAYYFDQLTLKDMLDALDRNITPEEVFNSIPEEAWDRIRMLLSQLDDDTKKQIKTMAYKFLNRNNVLLWIRAHDIDKFANLINHRNGIIFIENFISYILAHLDIILGI